MTHTPVLLPEVLDGLQCHKPGIFLDCTLGCGGHAEAILARHPENCVIGIDRDVMALDIAKKRLAQFGPRAICLHERFERLEQVWRQSLAAELLRNSDRLSGVDGILFDLGVSSLQLDDAARGFSFQQTGPLDMRMDASRPAGDPGQTAYGIVNTYAVERLAEIFFRYGEERHARRIARKIVEARAAHPLETTTQLADIVFQAIPRRLHPKGIHPATRVFQALRIEVNAELQQLGDAVELATRYLREGGRICVISFHSLEDRIVKRTFVKLAKGCQCPPQFPVCVCGLTPSLKIVSKKPIVANDEERQCNPRSRSAKLRIAEKIRS